MENKTITIAVLALVVVSLTMLTKCNNLLTETNEKIDYVKSLVIEAHEELDELQVKIDEK